MFLRFRSIVCCFQCFVRGSPPFGKVVSHKTPLPLRNYCPWTPPPPRNFQWFSMGGDGYFLEPHILGKETGLTRWLASHFVFIQKQTEDFLLTQTKLLPVVGGAVEGKTGRKSSLHKSSFLQHFTESSLAWTWSGVLHCISAFSSGGKQP